MGGDGGTCCKARSIMTKTKKEKKKQDREYEVNAKWTFCSISGKSLTKPIVSCQLGKLYNKDAVIEFLLDRAKQSPETQRRLKHIKGLKDVVELRLTANPSHRVDAHGTQHGAKYHCPISTIEMNGRLKFGYILSTGMVLSDRAIQQLKEENMIIDPSNEKKYPLDDIVYINLEDEIDIEKQQAKMKMRKEAKKALKASKRPKTDGDNGPPKKKKSLIVPQRLEKSTINSKLNTITRTSIRDGEQSVKDQKKKSEILSGLFTSHDSFIGDLTAEALAGRTANMATAAIQNIKNGVRTEISKETQKNLKYARYKAGGLNN